MRSPALAIAWEFRQRHRFALIAFFSYFTILGVVRVLFLGPDSLTLDRPSGLAAAVVVPLWTTAMYLLAVFSYGLGGDMAARPSIYPARMFTLPVTTAALAGWPMLLGTAAIASLWLSAALLARWSWGIVLPLIWPALLGAVFLAWTQVLTWKAYGLPGLRIVVSVLWLSSLGAAGPFAVEYKVSESRLVAMLAPQLPLAYLAAWLVLRRARRGEVPDWRGAFAIGPGTDVLLPRKDRFPSPERAQLWFEWRREGWILPLAVGLVLPFELGLLYLASDEPAFLVFGTLLAVLLTPPFMAGFAGAIAGRSGRDGSDSRGETFAATRPLSSAALVAAKLRMALGSALLAWLLVLAAVPLALTLTDTWPVVLERITRAIEPGPASRGRAGGLGLRGARRQLFQDLRAYHRLGGDPRVPRRLLSEAAVRRPALVEGPARDDGHRCSRRAGRARRHPSRAFPGARLREPTQPAGGPTSRRGPMARRGARRGGAQPGGRVQGAAAHRAGVRRARRPPRRAGGVGRRLVAGNDGRSAHRLGAAPPGHAASLDSEPGPRLGVDRGRAGMNPPARPSLSPYELRREGWKALTERLGIAGAIRFLMQYEPGGGDYTVERRQLFSELRLDDVLAELKARGKQGGSSGA